MTEVTLDMIYRLALEVRDIQSDVLASTSETLGEMRAMWGHLAIMREDTQNILAILDRQDARLGRIECRLELVEPATV